MSRRHLSLKTKLASALLQLRDPQGDLYIDWESAKQLSADQIVSLFHFDHYPLRHEAGGPDEPWNLQPRLISEHRIKTSKIDIPEAAKIKRLSRAEEEFRKRMLTPRDQREPKKGKWPKRPMRRTR